MPLAALPIDAPALTPVPRGRLLDVARPLSDLIRSPINGDEAVAERWTGNGVTWSPNGCFALDTADVDACARIDLTANARPCDAVITQTPFSVYKAIIGSALEYSYAELEAIVNGWVTDRLSAAFARELLTASVSGDKALRKDAHPAVKQTFATSAPIAVTLSKIEDDLAVNLRGNRGMIHMPPGMLAHAVAQYGVTLMDGQWQTPLGNLVVADAGYASTNVSGGVTTTIQTQPQGGGAAPTATTDWIYGSGMVYVGRTTVDTVQGGNVGSTVVNQPGLVLSGQPNASFRSRNEFTMFSIAYGILVFDPCPVVAALATYESADMA